VLQDLPTPFEGLGGRADTPTCRSVSGLEEGDGQHFGREAACGWIRGRTTQAAPRPSAVASGFSFPNDFSPAGETLDAASEKPSAPRPPAAPSASSSLSAVYSRCRFELDLMGSIAMDGPYRARAHRRHGDDP